MSKQQFTPEARFMEAAIEMALDCDNRVEHPVGAVIVRNGEIVSRASNHAHRDPTYHAEWLAIAGAQIALNSKRLEDCELYSTLEPCTLICAGPILVRRLAVVVYGASTAQAQTFTEQNPDRPWMTNDDTFSEYARRTPWAKTRIVGDFLADECGALFAKTPRAIERAKTPDGRKLHISSLVSIAPPGDACHIQYR